jgi:hypothetical protein
MPFVGGYSFVSTKLVNRCKDQFCTILSITTILYGSPSAPMYDVRAHYYFFSMATKWS